MLLIEEIAGNQRKLEASGQAESQVDLINEPQLGRVIRPPPPPLSQATLVLGEFRRGKNTGELICH